MNQLLLAQPHHDGSATYVSGTSHSLGDSVPVRVRVPHGEDGDPGATQVVLRAVHDGEPAVVPAVLISSDESNSWWQAQVRVRNPVTTYRFLIVGTDGGYHWLNGAGIHGRDVTDAADFRLVAYSGPPDWVCDQVPYQVFPDRFSRSECRHPVPGWAEPAQWDDPVVHKGPRVQHQWYGGDLDGVVARLDYVQDLGATLLYLTPVFEARSNHRYDAVSFDRVDAALGGDEALLRLIAAAHERGIRVVGDLTTNHTGAEHEWFLRAIADPHSEEAGFYRFRAHPKDYEAWLNVATLPKLDHTSVGLRTRLYEGENSVVARWLRAGLDGWRIDVANMTGRLEDEDLTHHVARTVRETSAAVRDDAWLLAEHGHDASLDLLGDGWHGTMDYAGFTRPVWTWLNGGSPQGPGEPHGLDYLGLPVGIPTLSGQAVVGTMREVHAAVPWRSWAASTSHLDSHDTPRFRTVAGGGTDGWVDAAGRGRERHLLGLALQMTMPGIPTVFMGDELGLTGVDGEHARTPFPWDRTGEWDEATLAAYRTWVRLRHQHIALRRGGLRWAAVGVDSLTYLREHPDERILVHVARASHPAVKLPLRTLGMASVSDAVLLAGDSAGSGRGVLILPSGRAGAHMYVLPADGAPPTASSNEHRVVPSA